MGYKQKLGPLGRAGYDKDATSPFPQVSQTQDTKWKLEALEQEAKGKLESDFAASMPKQQRTTGSSYDIKTKQMKDDALTRGAKRLAASNNVDITSGEQMSNMQIASYYGDAQTRADADFEAKTGLPGAVGIHKIPKANTQKEILSQKEDMQTIQEMNIAATKGYRPGKYGVQPVSKDTSKKLQTFGSTGVNMETGEKRIYGATQVTKTPTGYKMYKVREKPSKKKFGFEGVNYSYPKTKSFFTQNSDVLKGTNPYLKRK